MNWGSLPNRPSFDLRRSGRFLVTELAGPHRVLSTSAKNGGLVDHARWLVNHQSCEGTAHMDRHQVIVDAQKEADSLRHSYLGTEHLMLAVAKRGIEGVSYDTAREQVVERVGEGDEQWIAGLPRPFTPRAKRVLEAALHDAVDSGREQFGPSDILLAIASDSRGVGGEVLRDLGVTAERLHGQPDR